MNDFSFELLKHQRSYTIFSRTPHQVCLSFVLKQETIESFFMWYYNKIQEKLLARQSLLNTLYMYKCNIFISLLYSTTLYAHIQLNLRSVVLCFTCCMMQNLFMSRLQPLIVSILRTNIAGTRMKGALGTQRVSSMNQQSSFNCEILLTIIHYCKQKIKTADSSSKCGAELSGDYILYMQCEDFVWICCEVKWIAWFGKHLLCVKMDSLCAFLALYFGNDQKII